MVAAQLGETIEAMWRVASRHRTLIGFLFVHHPAGTLCILPAHRPRAIGGAFGVGSGNYENSG